jgi:hypothetical protein
MFRILFFFFVLLTIGFVFAQESGNTPSVGDSFEVTVREKELLLKKTEEAMKWFHALSSTERQQLNPNHARDKIKPLELMQTAAILKQNGQPDMSRMARELLPFLQPTPLECFEILERLGDKLLDSFKEERELLANDAADSTTRIKEGANRFFKESLNPAEKLTLLQEPQTPMQLAKVIDILMITGRPVVVRYYLRKLLELNPEPQEYAKIAESLGSRKLLQIANNKDFEPHGKQTVAKIIDEAKKVWQDDNIIAEALENWQHPEHPKNTKPLHALWKGHNLSLAQLIGKLAEIDNEYDSTALLSVIRSFSTNGRESLAAALDSNNPALIFNAAEALANLIHANETFLLYPALFDNSQQNPFSKEQRDKLLQILKNRGLKLPNTNNATENAAAELFNRANDYFIKKRPLTPEFDGYVRLWNWDEKEKKVKYLRMVLPDAYRFFAHRYAEQAYRIKPEIREIQRLYLLTRFEQTAHLIGRDTLFGVNNKEKITSENANKTTDDADKTAENANETTEDADETAENANETTNNADETAENANETTENADETAENVGETSLFGLSEVVANIEPDPKKRRSLLEEVLLFAIRREYYAAAQVAVQMLGTLNDKDALIPTADGKPSPLIQAVIAKDQRVRFTALEAIMTLQPETPYAGSSFVTETLVWFAHANGQRVLISAHPGLANAAQTAGFFTGCGYQSSLAQTCRETMQLAANTPDTELVVVDLLTSEPSVSEFVQNMRNDPRTANIPIAILTNNEITLQSAPNSQNKTEMQHIDQLQPNAPFNLALAQTYPRIVNENGAQWLNNDLFTKTGVQHVPPNLRIQQAQKSLQWIKIIIENAQNGRKIYHFDDLEHTVINALRSDVRVEQGLELAATIKSNPLQVEIYETAANALHPIEIRQKAANAFKKSVQTFGVLLRGKQVQRLYDRYNASEFEPKETQELLGSIIDFVEEKTK